MLKTFFIIEDHSLMRHGISNWITENSLWKCAGSAENEEDAVQKLNELFSREDKAECPDVIITDINLGNSSDDYSGLKLITRVLDKYKDAKFICYTMYKSPGLIKMAMDAGALGFVSKNASEKELLECMEQVFAGNKYLEKNLTVSAISYTNEVSSLTKREQSVLNLMIQYKTNDEIAEILGIQKRAVEAYTSRIYDKTGCSNRHSLIEMFK